MGFNDRYFDKLIENEEQCPVCGKHFICVVTEQVVGCKVKDEKICPYCGGTNKQNNRYAAFAWQLLKHKHL